MSSTGPLVDVIAGARPNFMKIAPILRAVKSRQASGSRLRVRLVHTGQHYDERMSGDFFRQLGIPEPDVNLEVGSGTQAEQTASIMVRYEQAAAERRRATCVWWSATSRRPWPAPSLRRNWACPSPTSRVGIRSGDWSMPEEINRVVTDAITNWFFTTSDVANANLRRAGVADERIFFVGNTMIDTLLAKMAQFRAPAFWAGFGLQKGQYFVLTLHRPANVDDAQGFSELLRAVGEAVRNVPVVFPVHPRTAKTLAALPDKPAVCSCVDPQPYLEFNYLVKHATRCHHRLGWGDRRNDRHGRALCDAAHYHRTPRDRDHRHQRADRHRPRGIETRAGPPVRRPVEERLDSREVGRAHG